jgi:hypothetical protein
MAANDKQFGGRHYKNRHIQPWDYIAANGIGFFEGEAIKLLTRWRDKNGILDLQKAGHYIEKLIEIEQSKQPVNEEEPVPPTTTARRKRQ